VNPRRREVVLAGHRGDVGVARAALSDLDADVRELALGACARLDVLTDDDLTSAVHDGSPAVRRRAAELAATRPAVDLLELLDDPDPTVVEQAAWSCGERSAVGDHVLGRLIALAGAADSSLVREAAVAALGALGDERGLPAILGGCRDQPAVRRRAVLALAPFDGPEVSAAIDAALTDRDWQVRQAAEDLVRAARD
jgi:HEAT repeat protein